MQITKFNDKLNYLQNNIYTIEEVLHPVGGVVESVLIHDNIAEDSINVYTGSKLTGDKIKTFVISTPSKAPWTTSIKIFSDLDTVYVTYETKGDTVEADDVNNLQTAVNETQIALNNEVDRATNKETEINNALTAEINRAKAKESEIDTALSDRYTKSEVFTKSEVVAKIQDLINSAREVLDTWGESA